MDTNERIIEETVNLFQRYGIRSVTMADIASHLSISKKTIYQYFEDKNDVIKKCTNAIIEHDINQLRTITESSNSAMEEVLAFSKHFRMRIKETNPAMLYDLQKYYPEAWEIFLIHKQNFFKSCLIETIKRGIKEGYFRAEIDPLIMATTRMEQLEMAFNPKIFPQSKFEITEVHLQLLDMFIYGISTKKGYKQYEEEMLKLK